ncbi:6-phosphofructokinase [Anaerobacillus sp. CMMVII]|uniref:6-phosphofructokinase n=1 Tax=Anaerobacillus sp. CMMVII TaxID=2755588 RepID=UPI0021B845DD|nr:6-phosphofructokinase [Anaerobacillus sp. CMMVII]MCT8137100.1 6-phosphofructokinase [Anaerobacillus sp. CMMVII]
MEIGVVNVGSFHGGLKQFLKSLNENMPEDASLIGVEFDYENSHYVFKPFEKKATTISGRQSLPELRSLQFKGDSSKLFVNSIAKMALQKLIVIGPLEDALQIQRLLKGVTTVLCVPSSIYNDVSESDYTLGYDTALNSVVKSILQVKDTASSLVLKETRLFCIQIPGNSRGTLLTDAAIAVDGVEIKSLETMAQVQAEIEKKVVRGETFVFLLMNEEVDPQEVKAKLIEPFDFRLTTIDEAQCMGPYPTALDRVLAQKFVRESLEWLNNKEESSILLFKNNQVVTKQIEE